jgi:hypothetical protein
MKKEFSNSTETLKDRYDIYVMYSGDRDGNDRNTGVRGERLPLKTFDEWLES